MPTNAAMPQRVAGGTSGPGGFLSFYDMPMPRHTLSLPLYATNPSIIDADTSMYLVRLTPLSIGCSALPVAKVLAADYDLNSWSLLVRPNESPGAINKSGGNNAWSVLARIRNSQDARGILRPAANDDERATRSNSSSSTSSSLLWVVHNTIPRVDIAASAPTDHVVPPPSRMELLVYSWPSTWTAGRVSLRQRTMLSYLGTAASATEKNWVPLSWQTATTRKEGHTGGRRSTSSLLYLSYSLSPHRVLRCVTATGDCTLAYETTSSNLWASALRPLSDLIGGQQWQCWSSTSTSNGATCSNASHPAPSTSFPPPRGGTPCVALFGNLVCLGHLKAHMRGQYKSTYFHFFYATQPAAPFAVVSVSHPFRFRPLGKGALQHVRSALGSNFSRKLTSFVQEKIQFASGLVLARDGALVVSWGVADCAGATRRLDTDTVRSLLARSHDPHELRHAHRELVVYAR